MQASRALILSAICLTLVACGQSGEPAKSVMPEKSGAQGTAAKAAPAASGAPASEAKKEEKHEAPDTHGMPGMSELFKGDEKK